jgi:cyclic pyranopterin phosphate synthase
MLSDAYGRATTDLRVCVTNRCNFRCTYCHNEGLGDVEPPLAGHDGEVSVDLVDRVVRVCRRLGFNYVKFTGGEPLLRSDLEEMIARVPKDMEVSLTTNGSMLAERARSLKEAGLQRINISADTLDPRAFGELTRGHLDPVLKGLKAALDENLTPIKLNMVLIKPTVPYIEDMMDFVGRTDGVQLQLIQFMPDLVGMEDLVVDMGEVKAMLEARAERVVVREAHHRRIYSLNGAAVEVVDPVGNAEFCANCHRIRLTHDGRLKGCLNRSDDLVDVNGLDDSGVEAAVRGVVANRVPYYGGYVTEGYSYGVPAMGHATLPPD